MPQHARPRHSTASQIIYIEVTPIKSRSFRGIDLSAPLVKEELLKISYKASLDGGLRAKWFSEATTKIDCCLVFQNTDDTNESDPVLYLSQGNPCLPPKIVCRCKGYGFRDRASQSTSLSITESTLVRVLREPSDYGLLDQLCGESSVPSLSEPEMLEVLVNHNPETIEQLTYRLRNIATQPILVATSSDSYKRQRIRPLKPHSMSCDSRRAKRTTRNNFDERVLLLHSPDHGAGKTRLVESIARLKLGCQQVYTINAGSILAKYGTRSEVALESNLHSILIQCALREDFTCVILDGLESFVSPSLSGTSGAGDAAVPVLSASLSLLKNLTARLSRRRECPFPRKNPLYNHRSRNGILLEAKACIVAIVTCPDDGWRGRKQVTSSMPCIFDSITAGRYRLPPLSAATRYRAFLAAMESRNLEISSDLSEELPFLAASATWARGGCFMRIAETIQRNLDGDQSVSPTSFRTALQHKASIGNEGQANVDFMRRGANDSDPFDSIGGNIDAKVALRECLSLDTKKRRLLASYGIPPPNGVLLYGPPGTGKTMLAKAVARLLKSPRSPIGGVFVSLSIADVVLAEVGSSEKIVASAFETARLNSPSVIFIDEFQALFTDRGRGGSSRLTSTLLQCMDDLVKWQRTERSTTAQQSEDERVIVLAATNTPWMIDSSFIRTGRFDKLVMVDLPPEEDRRSILDIHLRSMELEPDTQIGSLVDEIVCSTPYYSGADLAALCRAAAVQAVVRGCRFVQKCDFENALDGRTASRNQQLVDRIQGWKARG